MVLIESGSVKNGNESKDDLNFSWDNLPNKLMRELKTKSGTVSEGNEVWL